MKILRAVSRLFGKSRIEADLDGELRSYVDLLTDRKIAEGMDPAAARRAALIEFGGIESVKEEVRDVRPLAWIETSWQDARYALRGLRKAPGFTAIALLSLALGIGANSAIFGVFYAVIIRPLPYPDSGALLAVGRAAPGHSGAFVMTPEFVAWQNEQHVFTGLASWNDTQFNLNGAATPEKVTGAEVSSNFLQVMGVRPAAGRDLLPSDRGTALISYELWQRQFGGDLSAIGRPIWLSNSPVSLIGVLPAGFRFPGDIHAEILVPDDSPNPPNFHAQRFGGLHGIGRLRPGMTPARAAADLEAISRRWEPEMPEAFRSMRAGTRVAAHSLHEELVGNTWPVLFALLGAVGLVLLLACANVANLQLARAMVRRREIGLRAALGASRGRLARLLAIENLLLATIAGIAGLVVASGLIGTFRSSAGIALGDVQDFQIGWRLAAAAFGFSTVAGVLVGLVPALLAPRLDLNEVLKSGAVSLIGGRGAWMRSMLVTAQVALALLLLIGSGLLLRSLQNVLSVDLGYRRDHLLLANLRLTGNRYKADEPRRAFLGSLLQRVQALPGVDGAAIVNSPPMAGGYSIGVFPDIDGIPTRERRAGTAIVAVTPDFLRVMGIRLLRGRDLNDRDRPGMPDVALVNESFVATVLLGADPIGKQIGWLGTQSTIVGVIADVRHSGPERSPSAELLVSEWQHPQNLANLVVRTRNDAIALEPAIRPAVWSLDKDLPVSNISTMEDRLARAGNGRRIQTALLGAFGLLALLLSAVGIYGVASEAVAQRTREIGLLMALGADAAAVVRAVMRRSVVLSAVGIGAGTALGLYLVRYLEALLYRVKPTDGVAIGGAGLILFAVALLAAYLPARRAARIDPVDALRCE